MRTHNAANLWVNPARTEGCECGATLVRLDTGKCERCTAKMPQARWEWLMWKTECERKVFKRSEPVPEGYCVACGEPYGDHSPEGHKFYCLIKKHRCACGRTYNNVVDLRQHETYKCPLR